MKVFLISCAVAIVVAVGSIYALNEFQRPADVAFSSKTGVRL
jgi:xanthosine utilization system XapX-like protein